MLINACQRWRQQRARYQPAGEVIPTHHYEVAPIASDRVARQFVEQHHYSRSYPAARFRTGLFRKGVLVGVAVLSQPASQAALEAALPFPDLDRAELGRFVLHDSVEANGESWFLARTWELARVHGIDAVVMHSDPATLYLDPIGTFTGAVKRAAALADDAFHAETADVLQHHRGWLLERFAEA
jgi:hypothetical protein